MNKPQPNTRTAVMFVTRCQCKRVDTVRLGNDPYTYVRVTFSALDLSKPFPPIASKSDRRFEFRNEYDRETGLPVYFEEGYYP